MTLKEVSEHIGALLSARREGAVPDNDVLIPLIYQEMLNIANRYKVLSLITKSEDIRVLRVLGDGYYIRFPKKPREDNDLLDIDRELHVAIANLVAATLATTPHNRNIFKKDGKKIVKDYDFKIFNTPAMEA